MLLASAILAVLATLSLRRWEASAQRHVHEQARDMATMCVEKVETALVKTEDEGLVGLRRAVLDPEFTAGRPHSIQAWLHATPFFESAYIVNRGGGVLYPPRWSPEEGATLAALRAEIPPGFWDRESRRHVSLGGGDVALIAALPGGSLGPLLAVLRLSEQELRRGVLEKALAGLEGQSVLAVLDASDRPVYAARPLDRAERVLTVPFGDALPTWRLALYEPEGLSPRSAVRRQAGLFAAVFVLLLGVIGVGLAASYRLVRRESEMARLKSDFVANVSHDLKTPLALIRMYAETLEMNRVPSEANRREYYGVITRESERLSRLIDNVLDFSRIESGAQRYTLVRRHVEPVIHEVVDAFRHPFAQAGFKLELSVEPDLPEIPLDAEALAQALANLVDNAMKYSGESRRVEIRAGRAGDEVRIEVADDGIGIPAPEHTRIFEKFYRIGSSDTQGRRGSGVGLTLVKHIVEAHGGRVSVQSRPGEGSRFTLHLPLTMNG
ncbi:MAG TPA: HAMP domain-containing sensor histidine kinase [Methylomirabilota bacterium]|nr:HAMP domain-containing sensor histidine kinase [Methylomirabilota bacterium]